MNNKQIEQVEEKTSYQKGIDLEMRFCKYLKTEMGFKNARIRAQMKSRMNNRGSNVDIIAERQDHRGKRLYNLGIVYLLLCALVLLYGLFEDETALWLGFFLEVLGFVALVISRRYTVEHVWVECKNQKNKVSYSQMQKTIHEYDEYKASNDREFNFVEQYFISSSGFVENALRLAEEKGVQCFVASESKIVEVTYWNPQEL